MVLVTHCTSEITCLWLGGICKCPRNILVYATPHRDRVLRQADPASCYREKFKENSRPNHLELQPGWRKQRLAWAEGRVELVLHG